MWRFTSNVPPSVAELVAFVRALMAAAVTFFRVFLRALTV